MGVPAADCSEWGPASLGGLWLCGGPIAEQLAPMVAARVSSRLSLAVVIDNARQLSKPGQKKAGKPEVAALHQ